MDQCKTLYVSQLSAEGKNQAEIARIVGVTPATISRVLSKDEIRDKVEYCRQLIAQKAFDKSVDNIVVAIEQYKDKAEDKDGLMRKEHGFKASLRVLETMGLLESRSQPAFVQNILNIQNNQYISPLTSKALSSVIESVDAEIVGSDHE